MFAAGRAFEQVRNSIGYPHLNVKIGATHAGISVGEDGASHQCCEDLALMRSIRAWSSSARPMTSRPAPQSSPPTIITAPSTCASAAWPRRFSTILRPISPDRQGRKAHRRLRYRGHRHRPDGPIGATAVTMLNSEISPIPLQPPFSKAIPHNSKCRYGERGAADAKPLVPSVICSP